MDELTRILDTAQSLFLKYGTRSVTMSDISRELGMSKKTLYLHVENKDDLIEKVLLRDIERDKEELIEVRKTATNALEEMLQMNAEVQKKIQEINPSVIYDLKKYHSKAWQHFEQFHKEFIYGCIYDNLQRGIQEGIYRHDINPNILSRIYIGFFPVLTDYELFSIQEYPPQLVVREFMYYHLNGIVSDKGKKLLYEKLK